MIDEIRKIIDDIEYANFDRNIRFFSYIIKSEFINSECITDNNHRVWKN